MNEADFYPPGMSDRDWAHVYGEDHDPESFGNGGHPQSFDEEEGADDEEI